MSAFWRGAELAGELGFSHSTKVDAKPTGWPRLSGFAGSERFPVVTQYVVGALSTLLISAKLSRILTVPQCRPFRLTSRVGSNYVLVNFGDRDFNAEFWDLKNRLFGENGCPPRLV